MSDVNAVDGVLQNVVVLTWDEYENLRARDRELELLELAGVDNWEGYDVLSNPEDYL